MGKVQTRELGESSCRIWWGRKSTFNLRKIKRRNKKQTTTWSAEMFSSTSPNTSKCFNHCQYESITTLHIRDSCGSCEVGHQPVEAEIFILLRRKGHFVDTNYMANHFNSEQVTAHLHSHSGQWKSNCMEGTSSNSAIKTEGNQSAMTISTAALPLSFRSPDWTLPMEILVAWQLNSRKHLP